LCAVSAFECAVKLYATEIKVACARLDKNICFFCVKLSLSRMARYWGMLVCELVFYSSISFSPVHRRKGCTV